MFLQMTWPRALVRCYVLTPGIPVLRGYLEQCLTQSNFSGNVSRQYLILCVNSLGGWSQKWGRWQGLWLSLLGFLLAGRHLPAARVDGVLSVGHPCHGNEHERIVDNHVSQRPEKFRLLFLNCLLSRLWSTSNLHLRSTGKTARLAVHPPPVPTCGVKQYSLHPKVSTIHTTITLYPRPKGEGSEYREAAARTEEKHLPGSQETWPLLWHGH